MRSRPFLFRALNARRPTINTRIGLSLDRQAHPVGPRAALPPPAAMHQYSQADARPSGLSTAEGGRGAPASFNIGDLFEDVAHAAIDRGVSLPGCQRCEWASPTGALFVLDRFDAGAECLFGRLPLARG